MWGSAASSLDVRSVPFPLFLQQQPCGNGAHRARARPHAGGGRGAHHLRVLDPLVEGQIEVEDGEKIRGDIGNNTKTRDGCEDMKRGRRKWEDRQDNP